MTLKYNDYSEPVYDKENYVLETTEKININDIIIVKDCVVKIIECITKSKKLLICVDIFTNKEVIEILNLSQNQHAQNQHVLKPKISQLECVVISNVNNLVELFDEENNLLFEIKLDPLIDSQFINVDKLKSDDVVQVIKFMEKMRIEKKLN